MRKSHICLVFLAAPWVSVPAQTVAQKAGDEKVVSIGDGRCRKEIREYVDAMRFVRQSAGDQIESRVAKGYVSEAELERLIAAQGYCPAAQLLRSKGANR